MNELKSKNNLKVLVLVAHPDDEVIWMGGFLMKFANENWTVFSLCRKSDNDRCPKFMKVCDYLGVTGIIGDLDDEDILDFQDATVEAEKLILEKLGEQNFDYIFTHGENGEYGHLRHKNVHLAIFNLLKKQKLKTKNWLCFNYENDEKKDFQVIIKKDSDLVIELSEDEFKEKKRIVSEMYGYPMDGIDVGYCTNPEAFMKINF